MTNIYNATSFCDKSMTFVVLRNTYNEEIGFTLRIQRIDSNMMKLFRDCLDVATAIESTGTHNNILPANTIDSIHVYKLYVVSKRDYEVQITSIVAFSQNDEFYDSENRVVDSVIVRLSIPEVNKVTVSWGQSPRPTNRNRIPFIRDEEEGGWKLVVDRENPRFCENCEVYVRCL